MSTVRIALANLEFPSSPDASVRLAETAIADAASAGASIVCFPETYVPGYRGATTDVAPPDAAFLERAWSTVAAAAGRHRIGVILGTERVTSRGLLISALVVNPDGTVAGFQDKVQIDPSEERTYVAGDERRIFTIGAPGGSPDRGASLTFGVVICHEGWRYPETVRWAARRGAQVVFHPHVTEFDAAAFQPATFADPRNTFHEKAALCRAAENTIFFATVNCAIPGSGTTSAVARPDGTLLCYQPYGRAGLLVADLDLSEATGLLASRCRT
jgi:predicted amidohydrolase